MENYVAHCEVHGDYVIPKAVFMFGRLLDVKENVCPHPTCQKRYLERVEGNQAAIEYERKRQAMASAVQNSRIPTQFVGRKVNELDASKAKSSAILFIRNFQTFRKNGVGLLFHGAPGTGKTHLACAILQALMPEVRGRYCTVAEILQALKASYATTDVAESMVMQYFIEPPLLVIDEIGATATKEFEQTKLFEIIDGRAGSKKPTIFISNLNPGEGDVPNGVRTVRHILGERSYDRIRSLCEFTPTEGDSRRRKVESLAAFLAEQEAGVN